MGQNIVVFLGLIGQFYLHLYSNVTLFGQLKDRESKPSEAKMLLLQYKKKAFCCSFATVRELISGNLFMFSEKVDGKPKIP